MPDKVFKNQESEIANGSLDGKYRFKWVEETVNFEEGKEGLTANPGTRNYLGTSVAGKKIKIILALVLLCLAVVFGRIFYLQVIKGDNYRSLAEGNRIRLRPIYSERGIIFDHSGRPLVENVPSFSLAIVPQDLPKKPAERQELVREISQYSGVAESDIDRVLEKYGSYSYESLVIKENLDYEVALQLYIQTANLPGVLVEKGTKRHYLTDSGMQTASDTPSFGHLLGYLSKLGDEELVSLQDKGYLVTDNIGKTGLEKNYEDLLRGKFGRKKIEVDALGREQNVLAEEAPMPGKNLYLTIDAEAQNKLEKLITDTLRRTGKKRAAGVVLDPRDGGIIALVSVPSFNNNDFSGGIKNEIYQKYISDPDQPLFNRAIAGTYPSGSTIKMAVSAAALQEGIITKNTTVLSTGGLLVGGHLFKDWLAGGHGVTNVTKALAWSINTFFYYIGGGYNNFTGLGVDKLTEYLRKFNLAQKTGLDIPGEASGFLPSKAWKEQTKKERWYVGDTYNLSIGQGDVLVTPLQVAVWTAAVANGGRVLQPHLVDRIADPISGAVQKIEPKINFENFISPANMEVVKQGMKECVTYGSCGLMQTLPFTSGGKTGTAQWSSKDPTHAWFTSFAPYASPQVVVTILVEEGGEGSRTSMPIARDFLVWWGKKHLGN